MIYARGKDNKEGNLPFIRPLSYQSSLQYGYKRFGFQAYVNGDLEQINYSPEYGEDQTPSYTVLNLSADYTFYINNFKTIFQVGAENIFNEYYSTYADWGEYTENGTQYFYVCKNLFLVKKKWYG